MRSTRIGACAGAIIFGVSVSVLAQQPQGRGKPADAGRPAAVQFPSPQSSVGVIHPQVALAPPGTGNGFGLAKIGGSAGNAFVGGNNPGAVSAFGNGNAFGNGGAIASGGVAGDFAGKASAMTVRAAALEAEPLDDARGDAAERYYSLKAVLPVEPGAFPSIQKQVPVPECFAR